MLAPYDPHIKDILPHGKMYTLQIGNERFVLSGASLSSDAPSYFTNYFLNAANSDKVLFIDRSPEVFKLIYSHLQGYFLEITSADDFTQLFNDALYYNLPRLLNTLRNNDYYYAIVGGESIKFPKKLLSDKANTPNFFAVSNEALFSDLSQLLISRKWIRPPPQSAPNVNRSANLLKDLIHLLQGVEIDIRSEEHRKSLIKEAKYYRFTTLVQQLIRHKIIYNPFLKKEEIIIALSYVDHRNVDLEDLGAGRVPSPSVSSSDTNTQHGTLPPPLTTARLVYLRPTVDPYPRLLQIQFDEPEVLLKPLPNGLFQIVFENSTNINISKITEKFEVVRPNNSINTVIDVKGAFSVKIDGCLDPVPSKDITFPVVFLKSVLSFDITVDEFGSKFISLRIIKAQGVSSLEQFYECSDNYV